jgi:hypothetical protein
VLVGLACAALPATTATMVMLTVTVATVTVMLTVTVTVTVVVVVSGCGQWLWLWWWSWSVVVVVVVVGGVLLFCDSAPGSSVSCCVLVGAWVWLGGTLCCWFRRGSGSARCWVLRRYLVGLVPWWVCSWCRRRPVSSNASRVVLGVCGSWVCVGWWRWWGRGVVVC